MSEHTNTRANGLFEALKEPAPSTIDFVDDLDLDLDSTEDEMPNSLED